MNATSEGSYKLARDAELELKPGMGVIHALNLLMHTIGNE